MTETRERIIAATNELFRRQGYHGTSLAQISAAAGATIGSIYHFFPGGKEALGVAVIDTTGAVYRELFESIAADAADAPAAFRDLFVGAAAVLEETDFVDPCPVGTVAREVANTSEPLRTATDRAFASWIDAAGRHLVTAGADPGSARDLAEVIVATLEGCFVLSRARRDTTPLHTAARTVHQLAVAAVHDDSAAPTTPGDVRQASV